MQENRMTLDFNNTEKAFVYKKDHALKKAKLLFWIMGFTPIVKIATLITPFLIKSGFPIKKLIRYTLFEQFVGGESLEKTEVVCNQLEQYKVQVILDYGVEGGEYDNQQHDQAAGEFIKVIRYAATRRNIPFVSIKITGLVSFTLLERINKQGAAKSSYDLTYINDALKNLDFNDRDNWGKLMLRVDNICKIASDLGIGIMFDAEESWIQDPIDFVAHAMMNKYNIKKVVVYNTIQLYRSNRLAFMKDGVEHAEKEGYQLGVKLVRGAYLEKEVSRAAKVGYQNPIQESKEVTDLDYDAAVQTCLEKIETVSSIIASHNENSNLMAATYVMKNGIATNHPNLHFSQLYGMSDNLTFNLADAGFNVSKYLPFGPIEIVIPYLLRRAQENSSIAGQTGREFDLIKKECLRRVI
jgi:proline dehydrogenase